MIIYKATNLINDKIYIGQTIKTLHDRSLEHKSDSKRNNYAFPRAIKKHGFDNFKWEVIEVCKTQEEMDDREVYWIKILKSQDRKIGYNIDLGGNPGKGIGRENLSKLWKIPEFREKMKQATRKGARKLTDDQVGMIKALYNKYGLISVIANIFKISHTGIEAIVYNKTWKDIPEKEVSTDVYNLFLEEMERIKECKKNKPIKPFTKTEKYIESYKTKRKLTDEEISKIRFLKNCKMTIKTGSEIFKASKSMISKIYCGEKFPYIQPFKEEDWDKEELNSYIEKINEHNEFILKKQKEILDKYRQYGPLTSKK